MLFFSKNEKNIAHFKALYHDEVLHQMYRYISYIFLGEDEVEEFIEGLKQYEKVGLSFYFYYIDTAEPLAEKRICGFSDFATYKISGDHFLDLSDFDSEDMPRVFTKLFQQEGCFVVSNNSLKKNAYKEYALDTLPKINKRPTMID